ncbi:hypothetical protein KUTeg_018427 [Tegillarca granosa]|uniref:Alpha-methylacyl-CoA racemase n=1 Tax=Tegillarca granosa TaxID=220873 RepID=A0ABQ9EJ97_TEGGR|nr:hypothetical protein KUTeg_018427 [Tegillarca granosa]
MALRGIRVVELAGLAPAPFCGMILADFGAKVIRVDRTKSKLDTDRLGRGKQSIAVDLKQKDGVEVVQKLCTKADVLIEPFRRGVMEKLGLGPDILLKKNPGLIYARLTGFGQNGVLADKAGHDINYIATSGLLSYLGRRGAPPQAPINLLADFAGGGLICAMGIAMALVERSKSGQGQVIDANMVEGSAYIGSWLWKTQDISYLWSGDRPGENLLDGGAAFYDTYKTSDGKFVSVGALEPQFFKALVKGLGYKPDEINQFEDPVAMKKKFQEIFLTKTRDEWTEIFKDLDACFAPVLDKDEAPLHPHNVANNTFLRSPQNTYEPGPAPHLSRTPGINQVLPQPQIGQDTVLVLKELGYTDSEIKRLIENETIESSNNSSKL